MTSCIGTDYVRLRIGIGHPGDKSLVNNYVLGDFNKEELIRVNNLINEICSNIELIINNIDNLPQSWFFY